MVYRVSARYRDACKLVTTIESLITDACHAIRNRDACKFGTPLESLITDACHFQTNEDVGDDDFSVRTRTNSCYGAIEIATIKFYLVNKTDGSSCRDDLLLYPFSAYGAFHMFETVL